MLPPSAGPRAPAGLTAACRKATTGAHRPQREPPAASGGRPGRTAPRMAVPVLTEGLAGSTPERPARSAHTLHVAGRDGRDAAHGDAGSCPRQPPAAPTDNQDRPRRAMRSDPPDITLSNMLRGGR